MNRLYSPLSAHVSPRVSSRVLPARQIQARRGGKVSARKCIGFGVTGKCAPVCHLSPFNRRNARERSLVRANDNGTGLSSGFTKGLSRGLRIRFATGGSGEDIDCRGGCPRFVLPCRRTHARVPFSSLFLARPWHIDVDMRALSMFHLQRDSRFLNTDITIDTDTMVHLVYGVCRVH